MELKSFFAQDDQGNKLSGATCYVYKRGTESLISYIVGANGLVISNPFIADSSGLVQFAAANGLYDIRVVSGNRDYRLPMQFNDVTGTLEAVEMAANKAETARDAAQLSAGIKSDKDAGLLSTSSGEYFSVPSADASEFLILYRNNAGVAVEVDRYSNASAVMAAAGNIRQDEQEQSILTVADEHGYTSLTFNTHGEYSSPSIQLKKDQFSNDVFSIINNPKIALSVEDEHGFASVYISAGDQLTGSERLERAIAELTGLVQKSGSVSPNYGINGVSAHRGSTLGGQVPENSIDAFRASARLGYRVVETDVLKTSDGQFVLMHNSTINDTCRNASDYSVLAAPVAVADLTLASLRENYVLASNTPRYRRKVPTLQEFLLTCRELRLFPLVEIKDTPSITLFDVEKVVEACIDTLGVQGFALMSFNFGFVTHARKFAPRIEVQYLFNALTVADIDFVAGKLPAAINVKYDALTAELVSHAHRLGVKVAAWTVVNNAYDRMLRMGVDYITTNLIAPDLLDKSAHLVVRSDVLYSPFTTTGIVDANGVLTLAQGQAVTFPTKAENYIELGSYYLGLDYKGTATVVANNSTGDIANSGDEFVRYSGQSVVYALAPFFTVTAGVGGCVIKDIQFTVHKA